MGMVPPPFVNPLSALSRVTKSKGAQPKQDHPMQEEWNEIQDRAEIHRPQGGQSNSATLRLMKSIEEKLAFSSADDLGVYLPPMGKELGTCTAQEIAAKKEYVRRLIQSDTQESVWYCATVEQLAEEVGLPPRPRIDRSLISIVYK